MLSVYQTNLDNRKEVEIFPNELVYTLFEKITSLSKQDFSFLYYCNICNYEYSKNSSDKRTNI
jgi:hypothetical protein